MKQTFLIFLCCLLLPLTAFSQEPGGPKASKRPSASESAETAEPRSLLEPDTELIDVPTTAVLDQGGFSSRTRFFARGGLMEWLSFGVYPRVNIGASFNIDRLIGTDTPVRLARPELQLKLRFFDGDRTLPSLAIGFDGQGYLHNRPDKAYNQHERGLYVMGSHELGLPGLEFHAGTDIADFEADQVHGFLATSYNIQDKVKLMAEWDSIRDYSNSRVNMGMRTYLTPRFHIEFSVRAVGQGGCYPNGVRRGPERVAQVKYTGHF
ncbi:MAG: hypothetical protein WC728_00075 [Elusimicrobiota bacterium]